MIKLEDGHGYRFKCLYSGVDRSGVYDERKGGFLTSNGLICTFEATCIEYPDSQPPRPWPRQGKPIVSKGLIEQQLDVGKKVMQIRFTTQDQILQGIILRVLGLVFGSAIGLLVLLYFTLNT